MRCEDCEHKPRLIKVWAKTRGSRRLKMPTMPPRVSQTTNTGSRNANKAAATDAARWVTSDEAIHILANMAPSALHKTAATKLLNHADIQPKAIGRRIMIWLRQT